MTKAFNWGFRPMSMCLAAVFEAMPQNSYCFSTFHVISTFVMATGGSAVKQTCWSYLRNSILLRNVKILLLSEVTGASMCWPFDFSIVILGVILTFFIFLLAIKIEILRLKILHRCALQWIILIEKLWFGNFCQIWLILTNLGQK